MSSVSLFAQQCPLLLRMDEISDDLLLFFKPGTSKRNRSMGKCQQLQACGEFAARLGEGGMPEDTSSITRPLPVISPTIIFEAEPIEKVQPLVCQSGEC